MADSVSTKWYSGQNPVPGTASVGYPYVDFTWNDGDTDSHAALISPTFAYPGTHFTLAINTGADAVGGSADMVCTLLGSNDKDLAVANWGAAKAATTITSANLTGLTAFIEFNTGGETGEGYFKFYKLKLDPSADVGEDCVIRVGINAPAKNKG